MGTVWGRFVGAAKAAFDCGTRLPFGGGMAEPFLLGSENWISTDLLRCYEEIREPRRFREMSPFCQVVSIHFFKKFIITR